jgi:hypothetical protein
MRKMKTLIGNEMISWKIGCHESRKRKLEMNECLLINFYSSIFIFLRLIFQAKSSKLSKKLDFCFCLCLQTWKNILSPIFQNQLSGKDWFSWTKSTSSRFLNQNGNVSQIERFSKRDLSKNGRNFRKRSAIFQTKPFNSCGLIWRHILNKHPSHDSNNIFENKHWFGERKIANFFGLTTDPIDSYCHELLINIPLRKEIFPILILRL